MDGTTTPTDIRSYRWSGGTRTTVENWAPAIQGTFAQRKKASALRPARRPRHHARSSDLASLIGIWSPGQRCYRLVLSQEQTHPNLGETSSEMD